MSTSRTTSGPSSGQVSGRPLTDDDIYMIMMLHQYQRMSSRDIARKFDITTARVRDIVARRSGSGCCG